MMTVETAGPVDPNAGARAKVYGGVALVFGLVTAAQAFHLVSADQAASIKDFVDGSLGLAGAFGFGFVSYKTSGQVKNGTFDAAPKPPPSPPAMTAVEQVKAVQAQFSDFTKTVADGVQLIQGVAASVPGLSAVVQPGSLVEKFLSGDASR